MVKHGIKHMELIVKDFTHRCFTPAHPVQSFGPIVLLLPVTQDVSKAMDL